MSRGANAERFDKEVMILEAAEIVQFIKDAEKKTPVRVFLKEKREIRFENCRVFGVGDKIVFGDWRDVKKALKAQRADIEDLVIESDCRNSAIPLLDMKDIKARIEPGAVIRDRVEIGDGAVVMMGAVINIGAVVGAGTMIDMGAILGGRATVGKNCHVGAGAVLAGVIEPPSAKPVVVEDNVLIGANAVVLEGVRVGRGAVVAAGAVVIEDVPAETVVAGIPARAIKSVKDTAAAKTELVQALREI
jgi:2,3,4,5-tetrahydropyridine-2-carboxylate N-succinyltransferase/tetrahydrodipicolinate N-acetyltransferase